MTQRAVVYKPYYEQIDWRNRDVKQSSLTLGALWALELLTLYGDAGANERCESCNKGEDLLACSLQSVLVLQRCLPQHTCVLGLERAEAAVAYEAVSYTHLTLPTICSV